MSLFPIVNATLFFLILLSRQGYANVLGLGHGSSCLFGPAFLDFYASSNVGANFSAADISSAHLASKTIRAIASRSSERTLGRHIGVGAIAESP